MCLVSSNERSCGFPFLHLPPELRLCVYEEMLEDFTGPVHIESHQTQPLTTDRVRIRVSTPSSTLSMFMNLLLTNHQVSDEAGKLLYRSQTFTFDHVWSFRSFLGCVGDRVRHLRAVEIAIANGAIETVTALRTSTELLLPAAELATFRVTTTTQSIVPYLSYVQLATALLPILARLYVVKTTFHRVKHVRSPHLRNLNDRLRDGVSCPGPTFQYCISLAQRTAHPLLIGSNDANHG